MCSVLVGGCGGSTPSSRSTSGRSTRSPLGCSCRISVARRRRERGGTARSRSSSRTGVDPSAATAAIGQAATEGQNARQQLKELCEKFSADLTIAEVTDVLVPKGSFSFEFAVDGLRCGVGSARSKKEAKEQAAALALRALAREPPRDL